MVFSATNRERMAVSADFRWMPENRYMTPGITESLVPMTLCDWLDSVIDNIIERRNSETRTSCVDS